MEGIPGWVIIDESKETSGYQCFKATREDLGYDEKRNERRFPIVAWFCPELPYPYGPIKYGGLPGLIMELQNDIMLYGVKSIDFGNEVVTLPSMPALERIDEETFFMKVGDFFLKDAGKKQ